MCIFCDIIAGDRPADIIWQSTDVVAFRPLSRGRSRVLVVPKLHVKFVSDLPHEAAVSWLGAWSQVASSLGCNSFRVHVNQGHPYQSVAHLHAHVILPGDRK